MADVFRPRAPGPATRRDSPLMWVVWVTLFAGSPYLVYSSLLLERGRWHEGMARLRIALLVSIGMLVLAGALLLGRSIRRARLRWVRLDGRGLAMRDGETRLTIPPEEIDVVWYVPPGPEEPGRLRIAGWPGQFELVGPAWPVAQIHEALGRRFGPDAAAKHLTRIRRGEAVEVGGFVVSTAGVRPVGAGSEPRPWSNVEAVSWSHGTPCLHLRSGATPLQAHQPLRDPHAIAHVFRELAPALAAPPPPPRRTASPYTTLMSVVRPDHVAISGLRDRLAGMWILTILGILGILALGAHWKSDPFMPAWAKPRLDELGRWCRWLLAGEILLAPVVFASRRIVVLRSSRRVRSALLVLGIPIRTRVGDVDRGSTIEVRSLDGGWTRWWLGLLLTALSPLGISSLFERLASRSNEAESRPVEIVILDGRRQELARIATWDRDAARAIAREVEAVLATDREPFDP